MLKMPSVQRSFSLLPPGLFAFFLYFWIFNRFFRVSIPFCNHLMKISINSFPVIVSFWIR